MAEIIKKNNGKSEYVKILVNFQYHCVLNRLFRDEF